MESKKIWTMSIIAFLLVCAFSGGFYMYRQQYQMAVLVTPDDENDNEWPSKRKWFDASEWLNNSKYIKINDFYILNTEFKNIDNLNGFIITITIHEAIKRSVNFFPELIELSNMDNQTFFRYIQNDISCEYLRTEFNEGTLKPTDDYFLVFFIYKGEGYELELLRSVYKNGFAFNSYSFIQKTGYWHSISPAGYSYRDYMAGKPVK